MQEHMNGMDGTSEAPRAAILTLEARPERRLIRTSGSARHVDLFLRVGQPPRATQRPALNLALVLDRSGSMAGTKLDTAKRAAAAVLDRLEEQDRVAVVVFDDHIDVLQAAAPATTAVKSAIQAALSAVEARASTALHEGWLTGCQAIATDGPPGGAVARCYLLTDGLANVGIVDAEQIAAEAASVRDRAAIGTSTFGIGADYDESLLGPLAVAGGGQFHHLRGAHEIASTFVGELGDLLAVAASQVRLEIEADPGVTAELVSQYWSAPGLDDAGRPRWNVTVGDLVGGEERHVVLRFHFPARHVQDGLGVRARTHWLQDGAEQAGAWQDLRFTFAGHAECDAEPSNAAVMHWVGLHHADRARLDATERSRRGELAEAGRSLRTVADRIARYAGSDPDLQRAVRELNDYVPQVASAPVPPMIAKEAHYQSHRGSRGHKDHR